MTEFRPGLPPLALRKAHPTRIFQGDQSHLSFTTDGESWAWGTPRDAVNCSFSVKDDQPKYGGPWIKMWFAPFGKTWEEVEALAIAEGGGTLSLGEPDPQNNPRDEQLEHRMGVPTPAMIAICKWWRPAQGGDWAICFKNPDQRPVVWRMAGDREWQYTDCPQPLRPHEMTWKALDAKLAEVVP